MSKEELTRTIRCQSSGQKRHPSVWRCRTLPGHTILAAVWSRWTSSWVRIWHYWPRSAGSIKAKERLLKLPFQCRTQIRLHSLDVIWLWVKLRNWHWQEKNKQGSENGWFNLKNQVRLISFRLLPAIVQPIISKRAPPCRAAQCHRSRALTSPHVHMRSRILLEEAGLFWFWGLNNVHMHGYVDCHCHISAGDFDKVLTLVYGLKINFLSLATLI